MTSTAGAERAQPAEASGKRKRDDEPPPDAEEEEEAVERKCGLDFDILECPICSEPFSPPVYQCANGHTACSACCKKLRVGMVKGCPTCSLPTGDIRCIAIEKILDSLLVSCKHAQHGCKVMLKRSDLRKHEKDNCEYEPFRCPVKDCNYEGSEITLPAHMTEEHRVRTVTLNKICGAGLIMKTSDRFVIVKSDEENYKLIYLIHHKVHKTFGDVFFCTSLLGYYRRFDLKVAYCSAPSICLSITGARATDLRNMKEYWNQQFLMLPFIQPLKDAQRPVEVHFSVAREEDDD
ncbi:hypothetical protein M758_12G186900 [Ceratodon purpureus]|nr:hypothetical protein M758_12G186900 [Ceratodon purpureus]